MASVHGKAWWSGVNPGAGEYGGRCGLSVLVLSDYGPGLVELLLHVRVLWWWGSVRVGVEWSTPPGGYRHFSEGGGPNG